MGRALIGETLRQAANAGAKAMFLEVDKENAPALALYERFGFVKVGERAGYYRRKDGTRAAAVIMRKALRWGGEAARDLTAGRIRSRLFSRGGKAPTLELGPFWSR